MFITCSLHVHYIFITFSLHFWEQGTNFILVQESLQLPRCYTTACRMGLLLWWVDHLITNQRPVNYLDRPPTKTWNQGEFPSLPQNTCGVSFQVCVTVKRCSKCHIATGLTEVRYVGGLVLLCRYYCSQRGAFLPLFQPWQDGSWFVAQCVQPLYLGLPYVDYSSGSFFFSLEYRLPA